MSRRPVVRDLSSAVALGDECRCPVDEYGYVSVGRYGRQIRGPRWPGRRIRVSHRSGKDFFKPRGALSKCASSATGAILPVSLLRELDDGYLMASTALRRGRVKETHLRAGSAPTKRPVDHAPVVGSFGPGLSRLASASRRQAANIRSDRRGFCGRWSVANRRDAECN